MLVSGVWRLWLTPRRKSSLAASSSSSRAFWAPTRSNSWALRTATPISLANSSRRSWSARSQPRVAGRWPTSSAEPVLAGADHGSDRQRLARHALLGWARWRGRPRRIRASIIPNAVRASSAARPIEPVDAVARRRRDERGEDPAELPVAPLELRGEPVVALGEPGQLVVAGDDDRRRSGRRSTPGRRPRRSPAAGRSGRRRARRPRGPRAAPRWRSSGAGSAARSRPGSGASCWAATTTSPNEASGRTAAATRAIVRRVRNEIPLSTRSGRGWILGLEPRSLPGMSSSCAPEIGPGSGLPPRSPSETRAPIGRWGRSAGAASAVPGDGPVTVRCPVRASRSRRATPSGALDRDEPIADAADGQEVGRVVRVGFELRPQPAHRHPDVGRIRVLGLGPAAGEQGLGRHDLADVRHEGVEQPRFGRRQLDRLAVDERLAAMELEDDLRAEDQAAPRDLVAEPARARG